MNLGRIGRTGVASSLRVASYNIRFAEEQGPHSWSRRWPRLRDHLRAIAPDILGVQEATPNQMTDLSEMMTDYSWVGEGRDGDGEGECVAIFVRRARLEVVEAEHYWLSDMPDTPGSATWGNHLPRMVTSVRLTDRPSGRTLYVLNTHLDNRSHRVRRRSARLLCSRLDHLESDAPVILLGDFNDVPSGDVHSILRRVGFQDAWSVADEIAEAYGTYTDFGPPQPHGDRLDWILVRGPVRVLRYATPLSRVTTGRACDHTEPNPPSDHLPVVVDIDLARDL